MNIRHESTREKTSRDKNARHVGTVVGRGQKSLLCDAGSELRLQ